MGRVGILIEIENNRVKETNFEIMTAAAGSEIYALVFGGHTASEIDKLAEYGASSIVNMTSSHDIADSPDLQAQILVEVIKEFNLEALLGTASTIGKDIFARVAAILDEPLISDCVKVDVEAKTAIKPHFSGKTLAGLKVDSSVFLCTIRPNSIDAVAVSGAGEIIEYNSVVEDPGLLKIIENKKADGGKIDLIEAPVIVTGGRAIKTAENFRMLDECAQKLGAAVGASRGAVDAGYAPHTMQVGQTGKTVSPRLYIACGVSGAIQHLVGMKTSQVIVAINTDPEAPIFSKCDYGIVGDIFDVVPVLTAKL